MDIIHTPIPFHLNCPQIQQDELLDLGLGSRAEAVENLREMQRINAHFGGTRALTRHLYPRLLLHGGPARVLDLGTGGAGLPLLLARWARKLHLPLEIYGVDWSARNLSISLENIQGAPEIHLLQADGARLPLPSGQVDFVVSTLFLHHLTPAALVRVLREADRLARKGVIMSDLVRGWLPYLAFKLIQPVYARNYLTRHDGALSVRRAYTPGELARLAQQAGLTRVRVYTHWPWRMTLVADK